MDCIHWIRIYPLDITIHPSYNWPLYVIVLRQCIVSYQSNNVLLMQVCAIIGGTFTVAGIIDSSILTASEMFKKHQMGKLS